LPPFIPKKTRIEGVNSSQLGRKIVLNPFLDKQKIINQPKLRFTNVLLDKKNVADKNNLTNTSFFWWN